jgi:signal transduction histidine kinase
VPQCIVGDRTRISQIVLNLLTNAIKFTARGFVRVSVTARAGVGGRTAVTLVVTDTGIGMNGQTAHAAFQNFSQGTPETRLRYGGTGLGLAICQKLVHAMGGTISVDSVPDFEVASSGDAPVPHTIDTHALCRNDHLVLVVDDDDVSRTVCKALLGRLGYRVETVANGREALAALRTTPFDLAVVDVNMPDLDGFQLARELHRQPEFGLPTPLVALTGTPKPTADQRAELFDAYLVKPVNAATLDRAIIQILARRDFAVPLCDSEDPR